MCSAELHGSMDSRITSSSLLSLQVLEDPWALSWVIQDSRITQQPVFGFNKDFSLSEIWSKADADPYCDGWQDLTSNP